MIRLLLFILFGLALYFLVYRLFGNKSNDSAKSNEAGGGDSEPSDGPVDVRLTGNLQSTAVLDSIGSLPVWFNYEPDEQSPAIYENTFWEIEPSGEYLYYLAGDYDKNQNGYLNYTSPSTAFSVYATLEADVIDIDKRDLGYEQIAAEQSPVDIDDLLAGSIGDVIHRFTPQLESNPEDTQFISFMHLLPEGAYGNARLAVGKNWVNNQGLMLSLAYEEFRDPAAADEKVRGIFIHAHCINLEQPLNAIVAHFIELVGRYKAMPYSMLRGATRY